MVDTDYCDVSQGTALSSVTKTILVLAGMKHFPTRADSEFGVASESKWDPVLIANGKNLCFHFLIKINDAGLKRWYQDPGVSSNHFSTVANILFFGSTSYSKIRIGKKVVLRGARDSIAAFLKTKPQIYGTYKNLRKSSFSGSTHPAKTSSPENALSYLKNKGLHVLEWDSIESYK